MSAKAWRFLLWGGLGIGLVAGTGCSSDEDPPADDGGSSGSGSPGGAGVTGGTAGTATAGVAGTGPAGTGGSSAGTPATGGAGSAGANTGGNAAGTAGSAGSGGSGGTTNPDGGAFAVGGTAGNNTGGSSAGMGGGGMAATLVGEIDRGGGDYVLEFSDGLFFKVNAAGARITDVHLGSAANLLTGPDIDDVNFGSTFWPSPQSWAWPPTESITEINNGPYTASAASPSVSFTGAANAGLGLRVNKKFTADLAKGTIVVDYIMIATAAAKSFAPWEITRFHKRGLTFFPSGPTPPTAQTGGGNFPIVVTTDAAGCTWHDAAQNSTTEAKLIADGEGGWLAHVDGAFLVVKKFQNISSSMAAPNENEIAIYVSGEKDYIEMEQEGPYGVVSQDTGTTWTVTWYVRQLPDSITPSVGNQMLVDYVTTLVQ